MRKSNKKQTVSVSESFAYMFTWFLRALVTVYTVLILGILPLYFEQGYTHIGTDKSTFFRTATIMMGRCIIPVLLIAGVSTLIMKVRKRHKGEAVTFAPKMNSVDCFALVYAAVVVISYLCTDYRETALWGAKGWYMGLIPHLALVAVYFLVSRFLLRAEWMLYICMAVSGATFVLGCLNRFDVWPIPMENSGLPSYISTIGNINWFCGYIVSVLFVGVGLLWLEQGTAKWREILLSLYVYLGFGALVTQGSDSGIFTLAAVLVVMFVLSARAKEDQIMRRFWWIGLLCAAACLSVLTVRLLFPQRMNYTTGMVDLLTYSPVPAILAMVAMGSLWYSGKKSAKKVWSLAEKGICVAVPLLLGIFVMMIIMNTRNPGSLGALSQKSVFTFTDQWGSNRGATWQFGLEVFGEQDVLHKLVGVGPDCMADYLYKGSSDDLRTDVEKVFLNQRLTNAHNEMLTVLVNVGICGMIAFGGMLICLLRKLVKSFEDNPPAAACGLCLLGYIANNIWSFQQTLNISTIFVIMSIGAYLLRQQEK